MRHTSSTASNGHGPLSRGTRQACRRHPSPLGRAWRAPRKTSDSPCRRHAASATCPSPEVPTHPHAAPQPCATSLAPLPLTAPCTWPIAPKPSTPSLRSPGAAPSGGVLNVEIRPHVNPITLCFKVDESSEITPHLHLQNTTPCGIREEVPSVRHSRRRAHASCFSRRASHWETAYHGGEPGAGSLVRVCPPA